MDGISMSKFITNRSLSTIAGCLMAVSVAGCNDIDPDTHIANAKQFITKQEYSAAIIELKNAIQQSPQLGEPRYLLGDLYLQRGDFSGAEKELRRALKYGENPDLIEPLLARALLGQSDLLSLNELSTQAKTQLSSALADIHAIHAMVLLQHGEKEKAKAALNLAMEDDANDGSLYTTLAYAGLLAEQSRLNDALEILLQLTQHFPKNSDVWLTTGHIQMASNRFSRAAESYLQAVTLSPQAKHYMLFLAQALVRDEQYTKANTYVDEILTVSPTHPLANELKASIDYANGNYQDAQNHAELAIQNGSQSIGVFVIAGVTAYSRNQFEQANEYFARVIPFVGKDHLINRLYASTQFKLGNMDRALETLNNFDLSLKENNEFVNQMSLEFAKIGRRTDALSLASKASTDTQNQSLTLSLMQLANKEAQGVTHLQNILKVQPDLPEANLGLAYYYLEQGDIVQAETIVNDWLSTEPNQVSAIIMKGYIATKKKDYPLAAKQFERAIGLEPKNLTALLSLYKLEMLTGKPEDAYRHTLALAEQSPENFVIARNLFQFATKAKLLPEALAFYEQKIKQSPNDVPLKMILARGYASQNDYSKGLQVLESLTPVQQSAESFSLATLLHFKSGDYRKAQLAATEWLKRDRLNPDAYIRTIQLSEMNKEYDTGIKTASQAEKLFVDQPGFSLMKVGLLLKDTQYQAAQAILDKQNDAVKTTAYYLRLQGELYARNGQTAQAVDVQKQRYERYPSITTVKDLALAYDANKQTHDAVRVLKQYITQQGEAAQPLVLVLAQLQVKAEPDAAIANYRAILEKEPKNVIALNNLAWLYMNQNDFAKACEPASQAFELAGEFAEVQDTYGYCLLKSGQTQSSLEPLKAAYQSKRASVEIGLHYAESLIANHLPEKAKDILNTVEATSPEHVQQKNQLMAQMQ